MSRKGRTDRYERKYLRYWSALSWSVSSKALQTFSDFESRKLACMHARRALPLRRRTTVDNVQSEEVHTNWFLTLALSLSCSRGDPAPSSVSVPGTPDSLILTPPPPLSLPSPLCPPKVPLRQIPPRPVRTAKVMNKGKVAKAGWQRLPSVYPADRHPAPPPTPKLQRES